MATGLPPLCEHMRTNGDCSEYYMHGIDRMEGITAVGESKSWQDGKANVLRVVDKL